MGGREGGREELLGSWWNARRGKEVLAEEVVKERLLERGKVRSKAEQRLWKCLCRGEDDCGRGRDAASKAVVGLTHT